MAKTVLLTGSSSGIGRASAIHFADAGWQVAATMRRPENETTLGTRSNVKLYRLDVTEPASIESAIAATKRDFGGIDAVVNNAGYGLQGVFEAIDDEALRREFDTNVFGVMRVTRAIIPYFRERGGGTIIQVTSMGGRVTLPLYSAYHATKWAVEGFSESLQFELRPFGIKVRIVEPGAIKTDFYGRSHAFVRPSGIDVYDAFIAKIQDVNTKASASGRPPEEVAATVYAAAVDESDRLRYPVGAPAPSLLRMRKLLPDRLWLNGIRRSYGI
jgi:NAD(P)-dependent dehydrogenase (short-subunit alcohol dehydrogenase family)